MGIIEIKIRTLSWALFTGKQCATYCDMEEAAGARILVLERQDAGLHQGHG